MTIEDLSWTQREAIRSIHGGLDGPAVVSSATARALRRRGLIYPADSDGPLVLTPAGEEARERIGSA